MNSEDVRIQNRLVEDFNYVTSLGHNVLGVFLQGSQNYNLSYAGSDIDTKAIHRAELNGVDIMIDIDAPTFVDRTQMLDWFPGFDEYHLICMTAPERIRRANNSGRRRRVPEDEMDRMLERLNTLVTSLRMLVGRIFWWLII